MSGLDTKRKISSGCLESEAQVKPLINESVDVIVKFVIYFGSCLVSEGICCCGPFSDGLGLANFNMLHDHLIK